VTNPLWPRETLELLDTLNLPTVRGNHDRWIAERSRDDMTPSTVFTYDSLTSEQRERLGSLPSTLQVDTDVFAVHGTPDADTEYLLEEAVDGRLALATAATIDRRLAGRAESLILCGHSHHQYAAHAPGNRLVLNPAASVSAVRRRRAPGSPRGLVTACEIRDRNERSRGWQVELFALRKAYGRGSGLGSMAAWADAFLWR
jgi:hypothetical protein